LNLDKEMDLLGYWVYRNFINDVNSGATFHFNSNQPRFHEKIELGETLWLVTGFRIKGKVQYHLAARFVIRAKTHNPLDYQYGRYRLWAEPQLSDYYIISGAEVTEVLLSLDFIPKNPIKGDGITIAQSLQAFRYLSANDIFLLEQWSRGLTPDQSILRVVQEIVIEDAYEQGEDAVREKLETELPQLSALRQNEILSSFQRNRTLVRRLREIYMGRCQVCAFDPASVYGVNVACAHHIHYLSRGGMDVFENLVLLCPNHHAVIHGDDAVFDYEVRKFIFNNGRQEPLALNQHL
jgi:5-methylcytosine-specific restriction enzyme A